MDIFTQLCATALVVGSWLIIDAHGFFWFCSMVWGEVWRFVKELVS